MTPVEVLADAFGRVHEAVRGLLDGIEPAALTYRVDSEANTIAWLVWHLTRVQDDHVTAVAGTEQQWTASGWSQRFGLPFDAEATGYGQSPEDVGAVQVQSADLLLGYHEAVYEATCRFLQGLTDESFERVVDERWDPPVTLGVRLVSIVEDDLQHAGQAALLRGLFERSSAS